MPAPFPHQYETRVTRTLGSRARIESGQRVAISGCPPPELDGDATAWSPEHLLLSSVGLCLLTTFEAFAARDRLVVHAWEARVGGTLAKTSQGLHFTAMRIELDMTVSDVALAHRTLEDARKRCPVANAIRTPIEVVARYAMLPVLSCST
jgi:organic hydroperoxide reductase OsmC/OhrA